MAPLDGKEAVTPTPFDAHEQAQAAQAVDYQHQEYPKAVDHVDHPSGVGKEPVIALDADHETELLVAKDEAEPEAEKAE